MLKTCKSNVVGKGVLYLDQGLPRGMANKDQRDCMLDLEPFFGTSFPIRKLSQL